MREANEQLGTAGRRSVRRGEERLPVATKVVFALGDHTVNAALSSLAFLYLFFLTQVAGLRPGLAAAVPWIGRAVDAFTDPIMGRISDRTRSPLGRRRLYFLLGALPFGLSFALLWSPAPAQGDLGRFLYYAGIYVAFSLAITMVSVPYLALIPELSLDYHERTSLNAYRSAASLLGVFVAVALRPLATHFGGGARGFAWAGAAVGVWLALPWLGVFGVSFERPGFQRQSRIGFARGLRLLLRHRAYSLLASVYLLSRVAVDLLTAMLLFYFAHWLHRPEAFTAGMSAFLIAVVAALPIWNAISRRADKHVLYVGGSLAWIAVQLSFSVLPADFPQAGVLAVAALAGVGYAAVEVMPWSMLADTVDEDELATGERREGLYAGSFTFLRKLGGASAVLLAGLVLDWTGLRKGAPPPESAVLAIRLLTGVVPCLFAALAAAIAYRYPLTRARHVAILAALEARQRARRA